MIEKKWQMVPAVLAITLALPLVFSSQVSLAANQARLAFLGGEPQPIPPTDPNSTDPNPIPTPEPLKPIRMAKARAAMYFHRLQFNSDGTATKEVRFMCGQTLAVPVYDYRKCVDIQNCFSMHSSGPSCDTERNGPVSYSVSVNPFISLREVEVIPGETPTTIKSFGYILGIGASNDEQIPKLHSARELMNGLFEFSPVKLKDSGQPGTPETDHPEPTNPITVLGFRNYSGTKDLMLMSAVDHTSIELGKFGGDDAGSGWTLEDIDKMKLILPSHLQRLRGLKDGETRRIVNFDPQPLPQTFSWIELSMDTEDKQ